VIMWEWIITNKLLIISLFFNFVGAFDRFATATPENYTLFGIPIGKYDNEIAKFFTYIKQAMFPGR